MAMEGNGGLGTSEEVREGQLIGPTLESVAAFPMEDSTQNTSPWLESYIRKLVGEACGHFVMAGTASVAAFPMEDSTQNTSPWLESYIRKLVSEAFEHFVKSGPAMVGGRRSGKFRLGVKVEPGFFKGIRVHEAKTAAFKVKHYKKESEEKQVPRALDDDVCTLKGIGKKGPFLKNLNDGGIFKVEDFFWKQCLDPEGVRKILGKTVSDKNWKTLGDHAKESVPSGKYHVYADNTKNSGVVFKNMSEWCGLIEDGKYYPAETLSDSQKESADTLKKVAGDNWKDIAEYDGPLPLEMNPSKRARSSQTDVVTGASEYCPSGIDQTVYPTFLTVPSWAASENSMPDFEAHGGSFEQGKQIGGSNSPRFGKAIRFQACSSRSLSSTWGGGNVNMGVGNRSSLRGDDNMVVRNTSSLGGNVNIPSSLRVNDNMQVRPVLHRSSLRGNVKCEGCGARNTSSLPGNIKCEGGCARRTEMASMDSKFEELFIKEPVD